MDQPRTADVPAGVLGYRVRVGSYPSRAAADQDRARLSAAGESANSVFTGWDGAASDRGPWHVDVVRIDPHSFSGRLGASYGPDLYHRETTSALAQATGATVGVNGGFFVLDPAAGAPGDPAGAGVYDGRVLSEPTNGRPAFVFHHAGAASVDRSPLGRRRPGRRPDPAPGRGRPGAGLVRNCGGDASDAPTDLPLHDTTCTDSSELVGFTHEYDASTPPATAARCCSTRNTGSARSARPAGRRCRRAGRRCRPPAAGSRDLDGVAVGDRVDLDPSLVSSSGRALRTSADLSVVNGGPLLVRDGREDITQKQDGFVHPGDPSFAYGWFVKRNPRTIAGIDGQGRTVLVTVDGRSTTDLGLSTPEAADVARSLGLVDAINLDGGGSTAMAVRGQVIGHPSDATGERPVGTRCWSPRRTEAGQAGTAPRVPSRTTYDAPLRTGESASRTSSTNQRSAVQVSGVTVHAR